MKPSAILSLSLLSAGLALSASPGAADEPTSPPAPPAAPGNPPATPGEGSEPTPPPPPPQRHMRVRPGYVLEELTQKLSLTADQQKAIGAILRDSQAQMQTVRGDDSLSRDERRAKIRGVLASTRGQVRAALTPDQQKLFDAMPQPGARPRNPDNN